MRIKMSVSVVMVCVSVGVARGQVVGELFKVTADDPVMSRQLGQSVAMDDGIMAVGCLLGYNTGDVAGVQSGSVYLFDTATGVQFDRLYADDAAANDHFGFSVDIDDGVVAIGAEADDDLGSNSGSVYLFDAASGVQIRKLIAPDGSAGHRFGCSVAIDGSLLAVGARLDDDLGTASGSVYMFDVASGSFLFKVLPDSGSASDEFGTCVSMDGGLLAVGSPGDDPVVGGDGAAFVFDASTGAQLHTLLATEANFGDRMGNSISIRDGLVVVGAQWDDEAGTNSGSAYVFDAVTGAQVVKLVPDDGMMDGEFGSAVAIDDGVVVIGGNRNFGASSLGDTAYLFDALSGAQLAKLVGSDAVVGEGFGFAVAVDDGQAAVTANHQGVEIFSDRGSVYVFPAAGGCEGDLTGDGVLDYFDISAFLTAYGMGSLDADFSGDGVLDFFDISAFLSAYSAGCP